MPLDTSIIAWKNEAVPGTFAAPTFAADALQVFNYAVTPIQGQQVRRAVDVPYAGRRPSVRTAIHAAHSFEMELSGAGSANGVPWWAKVLRAAMFGAAVPGVAECAIPLTSAGDGGAGSILGNKDNIQHRGFSTRGSIVFNFTEKDLPRIGFSGLCLIEGGEPAVASTPMGVVLPVYPAPVEVNLRNTAIFLDTFLLGVRSLTIDMGMKTVFYSHTGARAIIFDKAEDGDRRSAGGTLVAELPDPAVKEYFSAVGAGTPLAFDLTHGTVAGNIIDITSLGFVATDITYSVENNRLFMNMEFDLVPSGGGNDELVLFTR